MINVTIVEKQQKIVVIEATGHSGYAESGKDIVCSAVSVLMENLINGLCEVVKINPTYKLDNKIPLASVELPKDITPEQMAKAQVLMQSTVLSLKSVADDYSKFIKIKEKHND